MKTNTKIALALFIGNVLIVSAFGGAIYYFLNQYSYLDFYKRLETRANITAQHTFNPDREQANAVKSMRDEYLERLPDEKSYIMPVTSSDSIAKAA
ncbi:MAG: two-component sensor histidine kinase, partial [Bacteroidetes bacterium]|nr:two-component sensor histidine kinase [Bacteroidota bacterium]